MNRFVLLGSFVLLAACGGGETDVENTESGPTELGVSTAAAERVLKGPLPEPCLLIDEARAQELLSAVEVFQRQGTDTPAVERSCTYQAGTGDEHRVVGVFLNMMGGVFEDSASLSDERVQELMMAFMDGAELVSRDQSMGRWVFVFNDEDTTIVRVITGVRGTAVMSDRLVSEGHITMSLKDKSRGVQEREAVLREEAKRVYGVLLERT
ncbi:MAG: hypothetical protein AAGH19_07060 [Pseudomonadota bacterium]